MRRSASRSRTTVKWDIPNTDERHVRESHAFECKRQRYTLSMENLAWILLAAIASGFGGYFVAYLKKKGENRAVREDIDDLKIQTAELTKTAKEIEAKISDESWNRQRHWELTRDAVIKLMKANARLLDAGDEVVRVQNPNPANRDLFSYQPDPRELSAALEKWRMARRANVDALELVSFACVKRETSSAIATYVYLIRRFQYTSDRDMPHVIEDKAAELVSSFNALKAALHRELRLQEKERSFLVPTFQAPGS
jgi:hypothetical protein